MYLAGNWPLWGVSGLIWWDFGMSMSHQLSSRSFSARKHKIPLQSLALLYPLASLHLSARARAEVLVEFWMQGDPKSLKHFNDFQVVSVGVEEGWWPGADLAYCGGER